MSERITLREWAVRHDMLMTTAYKQRRDGRLPVHAELVNGVFYVLLHDPAVDAAWVYERSTVQRGTGHSMHRHGGSVGGVGPTYCAWSNMWTRCTNPNYAKWDRYGGRGITVDPAWEDYAVFLSDMGEKPEGMSLDRIDNDANYEKANCRWATKHQQMNNRSTNKRYEHAGEDLTLSEWATRTGIPYSVLHSRLCRYGWVVERALTTPSRVKKTL